MRINIYEKDIKKETVLYIYFVPSSFIDEMYNVKKLIKLIFQILNNTP
jgi:hypothetical protein